MTRLIGQTGLRRGWKCSESRESSEIPGKGSKAPVRKDTEEGGRIFHDKRLLHDRTAWHGPERKWSVSQLLFADRTAFVADTKERKRVSCSSVVHRLGKRGDCGPAGTWDLKCGEASDESLRLWMLQSGCPVKETWLWMFIGEETSRVSVRFKSKRNVLSCCPFEI